MSEDNIRAAAYAKWEADGRPDGQHERHWQEASDEQHHTSDIPQTWSADHGGGVGAGKISSTPIHDEGIRSDDLDTENDQGTG